MDAAAAIVGDQAGDQAQLYIDEGAPAAQAIGHIYLGAIATMILLSLFVTALTMSLLTNDLAPEWRLLGLLGVDHRRRRRLMAGVAAVGSGLGAAVGLTSVS